MPYKDPTKRKEYMNNYHEINKEKNRERKRENDAKYYENNKEKIRERKQKYDIERIENIKQHALNSIASGIINDRKKWDIWCNRIKSSARQIKHPYSDDFTNDVMFEMMIQGCFYCGDMSTTIDRIDSKLNHIIDNCVGCCWGCNNSKGVSDPSTFIRKAYYRARGKYYDDDTDIWFIHSAIPDMYDYKKRSKKQGVSFDLSKEDWKMLTRSNCVYCKRNSTTWFGIDRVTPSLGYVIDNVVSCCWDCNRDKFKYDVESMMKRNERIAVRMDAGVIGINNNEKMPIP